MNRATSALLLPTRSGSGYAQDNGSPNMHGWHKSLDLKTGGCSTITLNHSTGILHSYDMFIENDGFIILDH